MDTTILGYLGLIAHYLIAIHYLVWLLWYSKSIANSVIAILPNAESLPIILDYKPYLWSLI